VRPLTVRIPIADPAIVDRGSIDIINLQQGLHGQIIGRIIDLSIADGVLNGRLEFSGPYAKACEELYCENEQEPVLTIGAFGVCLTF